MIQAQPGSKDEAFANLEKCYREQRLLELLDVTGIRESPHATGSPVAPLCSHAKHRSQLLHLSQAIDHDEEEQTA